MEIWNGALHVHTTLSDGSGTIPDVLHAAKAAGLRFLLVTDHDRLPPEPWREGYHDGVLLGFGVEVTPPTNHFLAFGVRHVPHAHLPMAQVVEEVHAQGGFGFAAHPVDRGSRLLRLPPYPWEAGFDLPDGIEVVNAMSLWVGYATSLPRTLLALLVPRVAFRRDEAAFALWDRLNEAGRVPMVAGLDAHAYRLGPFTVFSYRRLFRTLQMFVYFRRRTSGTEADVALVYEAIRLGRSFAAWVDLGDPEGFHFEVEGALPGESVPFAAQPVAHLLTPPGGVGRILQNGRVLAEGPHDLEAKVPAPGPVRGEVRRGGQRWVFTNPVYVTSDEGAPSGREGV